MTAADPLLELLASRAYRRGQFTLAQAAASTTSIASRSPSAAAAPSCRHQIVALVEPDAVAVAGLTLGADPMVSWVAHAAALGGRELDALIVRKEAKGHGTGAWLEGPLPEPGARITLLEDVVTSGGSALKAVKQLRAAGYQLERVVAIVDREEGGAAALAAEGLELKALYQLSAVSAQHQLSQAAQS